MMDFNYGNYGSIYANRNYGLPYNQNVNFKKDVQNPFDQNGEAINKNPEKKKHTTAKVLGFATLIAATAYLIKTGKANKIIDFAKKKNPLKGVTFNGIKEKANTFIDKAKGKINKNPLADAIKEKTGQIAEKVKKSLGYNNDLIKVRPTAKEAEIFQSALTKAKKGAEVASAFAKGGAKMTFKEIQAAYDLVGKKMPRLSDKLKWAEKLALWQDMLRTESPVLKSLA